MYKKILALFILIVTILFFSTSPVSAQTFGTRSSNRLSFDDFWKQFRRSPTPKPSATATPSPIPTGTPKPTATHTSTPTVSPNPTSPPNNGSGFNRPLVSVTLDDASKTQFTNGWPIMQKYGIRGTFYVTTGNLDGNWHMSEAQVKTLHQNGNHMADHTVTHPDLTSISAQSVENELSQSKSYLENLLGTSVVDFASPYGSYNGNVLNQIKKYFRSHRTVNEGFNTKQTVKLSELVVKNVLNTTSASEVSNWINQAKSQNSWLILVYHEVKNNPDKWSTSPSVFESHMQMLKNSGVPIVTVKQAIEEITPQL